MIKTNTILEVKNGDKVFKFECDPLSSLGQIYDVLSQMKSFVVGKMNEIQKAEDDQRKSNDSSKAIEEPPKES